MKSQEGYKHSERLEASQPRFNAVTFTVSSANMLK